MFLEHMNINDDDLEAWIKVVAKDMFCNGIGYMKFITQQRLSKLRHIPFLGFGLAKVCGLLRKYYNGFENTMMLGQI